MSLHGFRHIAPGGQREPAHGDRQLPGCGGVFKPESQLAEKRGAFERSNAQKNFFPMAYNESLAARVRDVLSDEFGVVEKKMFGGLPLCCGAICVGASSMTICLCGWARRITQQRLPCHARMMDFTGKPMQGFIYVDPAGIASDDDLAVWVSRGVAYSGESARQVVNRENTGKLTKKRAGRKTNHYAAGSSFVCRPAKPDLLPQPRANAMPYQLLIDTALPPTMLEMLGDACEIHFLKDALRDDALLAQIDAYLTYGHPPTDGRAHGPYVPP